MVRCAVVGAGIIGLSIAWELARAGREVVVIDPGPARGATRAAAGMLAAVTEFHASERALLALSLPAAARWPRWAGDLGAASAMDTGFTPAGTLVVAGDAGDRAALSDLADAQAAAGLPVRELGTRGARELEPLLNPRIAGAFGAPGDGSTDPRRTTAALLAVLAAHPRVRLLPARATRCHAGQQPAVEYAGGPEHDAGRLECDEVILATGCGRLEDGIHGLARPLSLPVRGVHGDVVRLRGRPGGPGLPGRTIRGLVGGNAVYIVPRADGEVVLGATEREDGMDAVSAGGVHRLLRDGLRLVPALGELAFAESIARPRPATPDHLPLLGRLAPGMIAATGFHRHGVLLSVAAAQAVLQLVGGPDGPAEAHPPVLDLDPFDPWRFS